ncbi:glycosyltransferase [Paludicola sp. MB14-C6]|uniref:glycosyltransferase n=1 Tax=Paludihabitans sp. MB14-C6 TaxID=3070656 RepID=UPI0027DB0C98|nr:glycosyltransferase [Paludicola sp. MB14-C6]WMJ23599.1 glycosyltransferase [Paludicola sp. MB14-C6]
MKVALFTETYLPYINGVVTHVKALKDGLEKTGHEVLVVTANTKTHHHYIEDGVLNCPAKLFKKLYNYGLASPLSHKRLKILRDFDPDVIHIHNEFGVGLSGTLIADRLQIPLVYTLHTMYDDYLYYIAPKKLVPMLRKVSHRYVKYLAKHATALTGPSQKVQEFFDECGAQKSVNVVPNPVELDVFNPHNVDKVRAQEIRNQYHVADDEILISFCGRLGREKSVDVLLNYWSKNVKKEDKLKLLILGEGPCLDELKHQAKELGISDMVSFAGRIEHDDLPCYYGACQLYITASLSDTNSISMKEAMATGLPVIHIQDPLNAGQVVDGVNGYIYKDADEMYQILMNFKNKTQEEKDNLRNSVINSVKIYGCEALAEYLVKVYQEAIDEKKAKAK